MDDFNRRVPGSTRVLFVCTGNICRSPFAEVVGRSVFADTPYSFSSAGTHAIPGNEATRDMQLVARERGLDLAGHGATLLAACEQPDIVLGMEHHHLVAAKNRFPDLEATRIRLLDHPVAITDPYQSNLDVYQNAAAHIERALKSIDLDSIR